MHFVIATYLISRTLSLAVISELIRDVSTLGLRFLCSFLCYDVIAIVMTSPNFSPIDLKLGI